MPLATQPRPGHVKSSWSARAWIADHAACPASEIELAYAGRWPGETRVRYQRAGEPLAHASIRHPGLANDHWAVTAEF